MWDHRYLSRLDFRMIPIILVLMVISVLVIASMTGANFDEEETTVFTIWVMKQIRFFIIGWIVYFVIAALNYRKFKEWVWLFYLGILILLIGLFFIPTVHNVQRWYRVPGIPFDIQPSEGAKLVVIMALSLYLENHKRHIQYMRVPYQALLIVLIPFFLILKQPDLGTALVLYPIALILFYLGGVRKKIIKIMSYLALFAMGCVSLVFLNILSHDQIRPYATKILKEYQYERLNPNTYHQRASQTATALGSWTGSGWRNSEFSGKQWLPAAHTDSVFAAFSEEFGVIGVFFLLLFFSGLIYFGFQVTAIANDDFGRLLSAGITAYLAVHMIINMGMMCGFLPITGVPLLLITYGGSSVISTMAALGILQSIYSRRFMF